MWVFGYGSLMWDGWEKQYGVSRCERASLPGYQRDFNKASKSNWGSATHPGPTLGLSPSRDVRCEGMAFEFPDEAREQVLEALRKREGRSFQFPEMDVELQSGERVSALVPLNGTSKATFIGNVSIAERARMAKTAQGSSGKCVAYVVGIHDKLKELGIADPAVNEFWSEVSRE